MIAWSDAEARDSRPGGGPAISTPPDLLTATQMERLSPHFPFSHGAPRVDGQRVITGIIYVIRHGLRRRPAPASYGPRETLYNRFVRWSLVGVFAWIFAALAAECGPPGRVMLDSTHLKAHRTASSWLRRRHVPAASAAARAA